MPGRLGVLHHERSYFPVDLREAVGDAATLVWILVDDDGENWLQRRLLEHLGPVVDISSADLDGAAAELQRQGIEGIITFVDDHLVTAAEIADRLGLRYHTPAAARTIANKFTQRQALAAAGVPGPRFWHLPAGLDPAGLAEIAASLSYPVVLKPVHGMASRGMAEVGSGHELAAAYDPQSEHLVEEYLPDTPHRDGRFASYLSVESLVSHSQISHVAVTGRFPLSDSFRETGNFIPAAVTDDLREQLLEIATAAVRALGVTDAALHTEIKLTPDGPRLIEVNGRLGGRPPFVLLSVSETNLFRAACQIALGLPVQVNGLVPCRGVGYWRMLQPPVSATRVLAVHGAAELRALPWVDTVRIMRGPGDAVDVSLGTDGAIATVRGRAESLDELAAMIDEIDSTLSIEYATAPALSRSARRGA
jgi:biotin carboxylase